MTNFPTVSTTIISVFCVQILILCLLLVRKRENRLRNRLLALVLFFTMLNVANLSVSYILYLRNWEAYFPSYNVKLLLGLGPALFLYSKSLLTPSFTWRKGYYLHFIPVGLEFIYHRSDWFEKGVIGILQHPSNAYEWLYFSILYTSFTSLIGYALITLRQVWLSYGRPGLKLTLQERETFQWLLRSVVLVIVFFGAWYVIRGIDVYFFRGAYRTYYYFPMFTVLSVHMIWLGFRAFHRYPTPILKVAALEVEERTSCYQQEVQNYQDLIERLERLMENKKLYLDSDLSLSLLAKEIALSPRAVSKAINLCRGKNFHAFINHYRIEEFKHRIQAPNAKELTLLAHAYASGFASKSTFNAVFKKYNSLTPRQYLQQCQEKDKLKGPET